MKVIIVYAMWLTGSFGTIIASAYMAIKGIHGWGWFLFVGALFAGTFSYIVSDKKKNDKQKEEKQ
jgi:hypothetical protein